MPTLSDTDQREAARAELITYGQVNASPTLGDIEVETILDNHLLATTWVASTAYVVGDIVHPTVRNGHRYRCVVAGTSGTTEPTWRLRQAVKFTEGASDPLLMWIEDGPEFRQIYDIRSAIHAAWIAKAGVAALSVDMQGANGRVYASQVYDHCIKMADRFGPLGVY